MNKEGWVKPWARSPDRFISGGWFLSLLVSTFVLLGRLIITLKDAHAAY